MANKQQDEELGAGMGPAIPGGVYQNADGKGWHDAQGRAVDEKGTLLEGDQVPEAVNADAAWRADMAKQREASASEAEPEAPKARKRG